MPLLRIEKNAGENDLDTTNKYVLEIKNIFYGKQDIMFCFDSYYITVLYYLISFIDGCLFTSIFPSGTSTRFKG